MGNSLNVEISQLLLYTQNDEKLLFLKRTRGYSQNIGKVVGFFSPSEVVKEENLFIISGNSLYTYMYK